HSKKAELTPIEQLHLARIDLYDHFIKHWFSRQKQKLLEAGMIEEDYPIEEAYQGYSQELAHAMLQAKVSSITYKPEAVLPAQAKKGINLVAVTSMMPGQANQPKQPKEQEPWAKFFSEKEVKLRLNGQKKRIPLSKIRAGCPLM